LPSTTKRMSVRPTPRVPRRTWKWTIEATINL
jgi:hypothetical protein